MVHTYRLGGYRIAVGVNSGAVHALSEPAYCVLEKLDAPPKGMSGIFAYRAFGRIFPGGDSKRIPGAVDPVRGWTFVFRRRLCGYLKGAAGR